MCKFNPKSGLKRIDPCMRTLVKLLDYYISARGVRVVACCCGHKKYPMSILIKGKDGSKMFNRFTKYLVQDLVSGKIIPRKKKFYKKDKQGYYYIPEVVK